MRVFFPFSRFIHKEAHGDLNACNNENWYPMHTAVQHNQINALEYLLENKANCSTVAYSKTPLHVGHYITFLFSVECLSLSMKCSSSSISSNLQFLHILIFAGSEGFSYLPVSIRSLCELILKFVKLFL